MISLYKYILHLGENAGLSEKDAKKARLLNLICLSELVMCLGLALGAILFDRWRWAVAASLFSSFSFFTLYLQAKGLFKQAKALWIISSHLILILLIILFGKGSGAEHVLMILPVLSSLFYEGKNYVKLFFFTGTLTLIFCFFYYANVDSVFSVDHTVWDQLASTLSISVVIFIAFIFFRNQLTASESLVLKQTASLLAEMAAKNQQQQLILEKENYITTILAHTPVMLLILDPKGQVKFCEGNILKNSAAIKGFSPQDRFDALRTMDPNFSKNIESVLRGEPKEFQIALEEMAFKFSFNPVWGKDGALEQTIGICMDISDLKQAEKALADSENLHREVLENAFDGIFIFNTRTLKPEACNRRTLELFKCTEAEFLEVSLNDVMPEKQPDGTHSFMQLTKYIQQGYKEGRVRFEWVNHDFKKMQFRTECSVATLPKPYRHLIVVVVKDISEQKEAEFRREEALRKLTEVNKELGQFAYVVSHDLKAPLRSISSLSGWIKDDYAAKLDNKAQEMLDLLIGRTERMHNLIEGVLTYSRVGRDNEQKVVIDLKPAVEQIIDSLDPPEHIQITLETDMPQVYMERTRMLQMFQNLLSNAIKFMDKEEGRIQVGCKDEGRKWHFYVQDNGPGIEQAYFKKIFQIFQTLEARDKVESTGVGLTIVKKVVDLYKGDIEIESELELGSTFHIFIPKASLEVPKEERQVKV